MEIKHLHVSMTHHFCASSLLLVVAFVQATFLPHAHPTPPHSGAIIRFTNSNAHRPSNLAAPSVVADVSDAVPRVLGRRGSLRSSDKCKSTKRDVCTEMDLLPDVISDLRDGRLPSAELLVLVATRFIGYAMTFAAFFVKLPQILKIMKNKTVRGLSVPSFELDVALCVIHTLYCYSTALPFSAYGDAVASLIQNTILLILVYYHGKISYMRRITVSLIFVSFVLCAYNGALSMELITKAFLMNQVIFVVSRGMQITKTWKEKDASQLSISSYGLIQLGKTIRIFTTIKEGATIHLIGASILGAGMNSITVYQILYYGQKFKVAAKEA